MNQTPLKHLGIIMDGNRRWARSRNLSTFEGHRLGFDVLKKIAQACFERGIKVLTVFAFSTENWSRSKEEIDFLFGLIEKALKEEVNLFKEKGVRIQVIGKREGLPKNLQEIIAQAQEATQNNTKGTLQLAINYGGQHEIVDAVKKIIQSGVKAEQVTKDLVSQYLYNPKSLPPDLIIRTSGEYRLSGFLLWQSDYSELYFINKHWPDFTNQDLDEAIEEYNQRRRRFGK